MSHYKIVHYIQTKLYEGKQPDNDGWYVFSCSEISKGLGISSQTVRNRIEDIFKLMKSSTLSMSGYSQYKGQYLYDQLTYDRGKIKFKRNPLSYNEEIKMLWAMKPIDNWFAYDCFDEKHRRRMNSPYKEDLPDVFPWSWSEEQIEEKIKELNNKQK